MGGREGAVWDEVIVCISFCEFDEICGIANSTYLQ